MYLKNRIECTEFIFKITLIEEYLLHSMTARWTIIYCAILQWLSLLFKKKYEYASKTYIELDKARKCSKYWNADQDCTCNLFICAKKQRFKESL